jgi:hypothetical protein
MSGQTGGKELMERLLGTESKGELLMLFHRNPGIVDTVDGVARRLGKHGSQIEAEVDDFLDLGILVKIKAGNLALISFSKEKDLEIQNSISSFVGGVPG